MNIEHLVGKLVTVYQNSFTRSGEAEEVTLLRILEQYDHRSLCAVRYPDGTETQRWLWHQDY